MESNFFANFFAEKFSIGVKFGENKTMEGPYFGFGQQFYPILKFSAKCFFRFHFLFYFANFLYLEKLAGSTVGPTVGILSLLVILIIIEHFSVNFFDGYFYIVFLCLFLVHFFVHFLCILVCVLVCVLCVFCVCFLLIW